MSVSSVVSELGTISEIRRLSQSLAMLDAICQPEWELRYFSFNAHWSENESMASMRNGSGDDYFIHFSSVGAIIIGCDAHSRMFHHVQECGKPWPGVLDEAPVEFASALTEPAFSSNESTFCAWRTVNDSSWQTGNIAFPEGDDPDGSRHLLHLLGNNPSAYRDWAAEYYEHRYRLEPILQIYNHVPLVPELVKQINPRRSTKLVLKDAAEIGYPIQA